MTTKEINVLETLLDCFEESHETELNNDHYGDGPDGCSYCEAIADARRILDTQ